MVRGRAPRTAAAVALILLAVQPRGATAFAPALARGRFAARRARGLGLSPAGARGPLQAAAIPGLGTTPPAPLPAPPLSLSRPPFSGAG